MAIILFHLKYFLVCISTKTRGAGGGLRPRALPFLEPLKADAEGLMPVSCQLL